MKLTDHTYQIGGVPVPTLVEEYQTPLYVYDAQKIIDQYNKMTSSFKVNDLQIKYAAKALSNITVLGLLKSLGAGIDAVSIQEIQLALRAGFAPSSIVYTPNCVSEEEFEAAVNEGVQINVDNLDLLEYVGHHYTDLPVCLRLNPHVMAGGHKNISVGHIDSKFGISVHQLPLVERLVNALDIKITGLHMHSGSDILDSDVFLRAADILFNAAKNFAHLTFLDFGSGFKVKYKRDDIETDIADFGEKMSNRFNQFCDNYGRNLTLMFEPGKYLVSEAGYFLVRTNTIKQTTSTVFAGVDSGFNHLIRPMFYDAHHDIINCSNPAGKPKIYTVVGYICETDTFGSNRVINEIKVGDILCFSNAGAYCFSMASNYNSRYRPAEVLVFGEKHYLIRKRETFEDLLHNQVDQSEAIAGVRR